MSYNKTVWHPRDIITAEKMQKIENQLETLSTGNNASFSPIVTNPQDGDTLVYNATQQKWVNGAGGGGAGGALVVHADENDTLDKTWKELSDAFTAGYHVVIEESIENDGMNGYMQKPLYIVASGNGNYFVMFGELDSYTATTENGYPTLDK